MDPVTRFLMIPARARAQPLRKSLFNPDNFTQDRDALAANTIYFSYDSPVIKDSEKAKIQAVAAALQSNHGV